MNIDKHINELIQREGGFVDHSADRGGPINMGITIKTMTNWLGRQATVSDIKNLSAKTAYEIYYSRYYIVPGINELPMPVEPIMLDMAVNHGPKRAIKMLQDVLASYGHYDWKVDGIIGEKTIGGSHDAWHDLGNQLIRSLVNRRVIFYENIVLNDETQRVFLSGWISRAESFLPG